MSPENNFCINDTTIMRYSSKRDVHFCETEIASLPYMVCEMQQIVRITQGLTGEQDGRTVFAPTVLLPWGSCFIRFFIRFSSFKQGAGSAFLCDQNLSSCSPNSRPQNVSSYSATLQDIRFGIISLYLSRKSPLLLHKKCNNCRNVVKLKDKSFVCTNYDVINCAVSHIKS